MKRIATLALSSLLAGCAGMPGQSTSPHYDYQQQAAIAPGFPVERVDKPAGYQFAGTENLDRQQEHASAWDPGSARLQDFGVGWHSSAGDTSVVSVLFRQVGGRSYFQPLSVSDGYAFIDGRKVQHLFQEGRYRDVAGAADGLVPQGAPGCAYGTALVMTSSDSRRRVMGSLSEGIACDELGRLSGMDRQAQLQRAYRLLDLK